MIQVRSLWNNCCLLLGYSQTSILTVVLAWYKGFQFINKRLLTLRKGFDDRKHNKQKFRFW